MTKGAELCRLFLLGCLTAVENSYPRFTPRKNFFLEADSGPDSARIQRKKCWQAEGLPGGCWPAQPLLPSEINA